MKNIQALIESDKSAKEIVNETQSGDSEAYKKFFDGKLKKFGVSDPSELSDDEKKKFFAEIEKEWKADDEMSEGTRRGPSWVERGEKYTAYDGKDKEVVEIVSSKKDSSGMYDVEVILANGKKDKWYLDKDDKIFEESSSIKEASSASIKRMAGLVDTRSLKSFKSSAMDIAQDLDDEGFESDEIKDYLLSIVNGLIF